MAKNKIQIDVKVDDKGGTKKLGVESKKTAKNLDKVGSSARTVDRNVKGAAQASSSGTKNFSKMAQGAGGLVGVYATLAATAFAVSAAFNFLKSAMDFSNLLEGQKALGAVTGVAYKSITSSVMAATDGQLKYAEAAKAAAIGTASGISPSQLTRLGAAAKNASLALGRDLGDSFDRLIRGVTKAEPELLDELGIILRLENATRKYGLQIGKSKDELNEFERSQAVANEVLEQAERKFGAMEKMMPPTAHALNQFSKSFDDIINSLKKGIAGPLSVIAGFLSNNMAALTAAVGLFAGGLLKQVLPSMAAWKQSSIDGRKQILRDQKAISLRLDRTKSQYAKLKEARINDVDSAKKASAKIVANAKGGTKSGGGALDYLAGTTDSKKSQAAANKAISHANKQIEDGVKKRTGLLKNANAAEVADLRKSYEIRSGIYKRGMDDVTFQLNRAKLGWKSTTLTIKASIASIKTTMAGLASAAATMGAVIGKAFFWLSMVTIAVQAVKAAFDHFYPATEAVKKQQKEVAELVEKYKTLGEEIERSNKVRLDPVMMGTQEALVSKGNAAGSLDIEAVVRDIEILQKLDEEYGDFRDRNILTDPDMGQKELHKGLTRTTNAAFALDKGFKHVITAMMMGTKITDDQKASMINLSNELQQTKINFEQLPSKIQASRAAMVKLIGTLKKPFALDLINTTEIMATAAATAAKDIGAGLQADIDRFDREITNAMAKGVRAGDFAEGAFGAALLKNITDATDQHKKYNRMAENANLLVENLKAKTEELRKLEASRSKAALMSQLMTVNALTNADKIRNIEASALVLAQSANDEKEKIIILKAKEKVFLDDEGNLKKDITKEEIAQLALIRATLVVENDNLSIAKNRILLGDQLNAQKILDFELATRLLTLSNKDLDNTKEQLKLQSALKFAKAGGTGTSGEGRGRETAALNIGILRSAEESAIIEQQKAFEKFLSTASSNNEANNANTASLDKADAKLKGIRNEIDLFKRRNEIVLLGAKADTQALQLKLQSISMNPAMTAFNVRMNELKSIGTNLNHEEQVQLYEQIKAQTLLTKMAENKQALFDGIASSLSNAFTSIVTGTASAKEAFKSMAISILSQISSMIAQMMVMRILMSAFGMGGSPAGAGFDGDSINIGGTGQESLARFTLGENGRYGGIFSEGKKTQGYATGGVARGSTSGYPATLHGTEAVVPLPNGRAIPVDMGKSGGTNNNNIVVNISTDGQSSKQGSTGPDMDKLGAAVASAVQLELHNQKRSGGILNPYGAA